MERGLLARLFGRGVGLLCMPDELRGVLSSLPPGAVLTAAPEREPKLRHGYAVAVGDFVVKRLLAAGVPLRVGVVDCATLRGRRDCSFYEELAARKGYRLVHVANPRSTLSREAVEAVVEAVGSAEKSIVVVEGEEDLLALPVFAAAPRGLHVAYGYPGVATVVVRVTRWVKLFAMLLLGHFVPCGPKA